jgi:hypothetical protein
MAPELDVLLRDRELLAAGDKQLLPDDVDPGHHLGDAVLDLDAGVHLQEEVLVALLQSLDGAGGAIPDGGGRVGGDLADALTHLRVHMRGRRLLDQLLVAPLDRAVALPQVDHVTVGIGEDLDLDVAWVLEVALEVHRGVREELLALARCPLERVLELVLGLSHSKALAAAAAGRLAGHRIADLLRLLLRGCYVLHRRGRPRDDGHAGVRHELPCLRLRPHRFDRAGGGADERDAGVLAGLGEIRVLGQEPITGVHRLGTGLGGGVEQLLDAQVALRGHRRAQQMRLVGLVDMRGVAIGLRVDADRDDPHLLQRAHHADGDLSAVRDEDLLEHGA